MTSAARQNREIEQLKTLLFQTEAARIETLETDVASLRQYVGGADRLEVATADILVAALERAEVDRPRELANVLAPSVVTAIRSEIRNSRDLMIDALYPITGRLVKAAVANAFKELVASLEQRLNTLTSTELWIGRVKSLATGRPISEFVLANSGALQVKRLLLIERGNGRLIADWKRDEVPDEKADLLSAMVAAILEFSVQALAGEGNLQKLDFGGREVVLRASPQYILAAECVGPLRPADDARINSLFFDTIENMEGGARCGASTLAALAESLEAESAPPRKRGRRGKLILFVLLALFAALIVWFAGASLGRTILERRANAALERLAGTQPLLASFPLRLRFDHRDQTVSVSGIEPRSVNTVSLLRALAKAVAPYRVVNRIGVVQGMDESAMMRADVATLQHSFSEMEEKFNRTGKELDATHKAIADLLQSGTRNFDKIDARYDKLNEDYSALSDKYNSLNLQYSEMMKKMSTDYSSLDVRYTSLAAAIDSPRERLDHFMTSTAIFFGNGEEFADSDEAGQQIRHLAELLKNNSLRIRIVGHSDESGSEHANKILGRKRAEAVMWKLVALGIEPSRLFVVSRSALMPVSDQTGATNNGNRRVTFENVFQNEPPE